MKRILFFILIMGFFQPAFAAEDGIEECSSAAKGIVASKHGLDKLESCEMKSFEDGKSSLVHVTFGEPMDCAAGCIMSHICSIVTGADEPAKATSDVLLFSFNLPADNFLAKDLSSEEQAVLAEKEIVYSDYPGQPPEVATIIEKLTPGKKHTLAQTPAFLAFMKEQKVNNGPFRWCSYE